MWGGGGGLDFSSSPNFSKAIILFATDRKQEFLKYDTIYQ